jgi:two-component system cell cycle sensor histidine kinase/response regulator CckA
MLADSASTTARPGARILLVDDEDVVRRVTASALRRFGYSVVDAPHGEAGIRLAQEQSGTLDLLLTDMVMSGASGFEVASAFRAHNPGRPVIFTSGYSDNATLARIEREGGLFLVKPYDLDSLASVVRTALAPAEDEGPADQEGA